MKSCPNFGCGNTGSYAVQLSEFECGQEQCQFCYCEPDSVFNIVTGMATQITELQSTITAQEETIKRLKEDAESLAQNHWYENDEDGKEYCNMCGFPFKKQFSEHDDDCPITLHTQLMNELGEK